MTVSGGSKVFYRVLGLRRGELPNVARGVATLHQSQATVAVDCSNLMFSVGTKVKAVAEYLLEFAKSGFTILPVCDNDVRPSVKQETIKRRAIREKARTKEYLLRGEIRALKRQLNKEALTQRQRSELLATINRKEKDRKRKETASYRPAMKDFAYLNEGALPADGDKIKSPNYADIELLINTAGCEDVLDSAPIAWKLLKMRALKQRSESELDARTLLSKSKKFGKQWQELIRLGRKRTRRSKIDTEEHHGKKKRRVDTPVSAPTNSATVRSPTTDHPSQTTTAHVTSSPSDTSVPAPINSTTVQDLSTPHPSQTTTEIDGERRVVRFLNIYDKGYRAKMAAWENGRQLVLQPDFKESDKRFNRDQTISSASVASDRGGNERVVNVSKRAGLISKGFQSNADPIRFNTVWLTCTNPTFV